MEELLQPKRFSKQSRAVVSQTQGRVGGFFRVVESCCLCGVLSLGVDGPRRGCGGRRRRWGSCCLRFPGSTVNWAVSEKT